MSIYGTAVWIASDNHEDGCAVYTETSPGVFDWSGKPCDCGTPNAPIVYEGSHVLPSDDDRRGGGIEVGTIPDHIERPDRTEGPHPWLRIGVWNVPSTLQRDGRPYVEGGAGTVVLDRRAVVELRDALTDWIEHVTPALSTTEAPDA